MKLHFALLLLIFCLSHFVIAQEEFTIPRKHRVIQESTTASGKVQIGTKLDDISFKSLTEETYHLNDLLNQGPVVFVFLSTECPVAQRYAMRLKRLYSKYLDRQVTVFGVYSNENDSIDDVKNYLIKAEYTFPIIKDSDGRLARHLNATMTPQAHLIDRSGVLRYRGAIDDNRYVTRVKHEYLIDALTAVISGKRVSIEETPAFGCTIHLAEVKIQNPITYTEHIAPLIQKNCQKCHHQYGIAPFKLEGFMDVQAHASDILRSISLGFMPPTRLEHGFGEFTNSHQLTDSEVDLISSWVKMGTPKGELSDSPHNDPVEQWSLGKPDLLKEIPIVFNELTEGKHASLVVRVKANFKKDQYIRGIDFKTTNSKIVRRIIVGLDSHNRTDKSFSYINRTYSKEVNSSDLDVRIGTWSQGIFPNVLPDGVGFLLTKGTDIILNVLYRGTGKKEHVSFKLGLYISKKQEAANLHTALLKLNTQEQLKLNAQKMKHSYEFRNDVFVFSVLLPMYVEEPGIKIVGITPQNEQVKMAWIKKSDIDWLDEWLDIYYYQKPVFLPKGTRLEYVIEDSFRNNLDSLTTKFYYVLASEYVEK